MKYQELLDEVRHENILYSALVELTYRCNLDCFFCYNDLSMRGRPLRLEDYIALFDDLAEMQVMILTLSGGEPLAHPQFFEIGRAARDRGFVVRIKSNGHALRHDLVRRLQDEVDPFIVELSLHGATSETHDRQTRVPGSFDRLMENIKGLDEMGMRFKINSALTRWNENELDGMFAIADSYGVTLQIDPTVTPRDDGDTEPMTVAATPAGLREFARIQLARSAKGKQPKLDRPMQDDDLPRTSSEKHCGAGSLTIAIDPYGNVYPCVAWRVAAGNLRDASIREIWANAAVLDRSREGTKAAKDMLDVEGELGKYVSFCPGLAVNRTGRPDVIPDEQRRQGLTLQKAFEEETEKA